MSQKCWFRRKVRVSNASNGTRSHIADAIKPFKSEECDNCCLTFISVRVCCELCVVCNVILVAVLMVVVCFVPCFFLSI